MITFLLFILSINNDDGISVVVGFHQNGTVSVSGNDAVVISMYCVVVKFKRSLGGLTVLIVVFLLTVLQLVSQLLLLLLLLLVILV